MRNAHAGHHPEVSRLAEQARALPACAGYYRQPAAQLLFRIYHARQLARGKAVTDAKRVRSDKAAVFRLQQAALHRHAVQRCGTVQHDQLPARRGAVLHDVEQRGDEGVKARAQILNVIDHRVQRFQTFRRDMPALLAAVQAVYRQARRAVAGNIVHILPRAVFAVHSMLRAEKAYQRIDLMKFHISGPEVQRHA